MSVAVAFSDHSAIRFRDRVRPGLSVRAVHKELRAIVASGIAEIVTEAPVWAGARHPDEEAVSGPTTHWLRYGPDVAFPLMAGANGVLIAQTTLTRGGIPPNQRAYRTQRRQNLAARRKAIKRGGKYQTNERKDPPWSD